MSTRSWTELELLRIHGNEPVYVKVYDSTSFPSQSQEKKGRWMGVAEHAGDFLTYHVLSDDTMKVMPRSEIRSAVKPDSQNIRAEPPKGEDNGPKPIFIKDRHPSKDILADPPRMPTIEPNDLLGRTFILPKDDNGEALRATITRKMSREIVSRGVSR